MPLTDFWTRWRRRLLPPSDDLTKSLSLHATEQQREAARRKTSEELAAVVATTAKPLED